jgi:hypothetical protein
MSILTVLNSNILMPSRDIKYAVTITHDAAPETDPQQAYHLTVMTYRCIDGQRTGLGEHRAGSIRECLIALTNTIDPAPRVAIAHANPLVDDTHAGDSGFPPSPAIPYLGHESYEDLLRKWTDKLQEDEDTKLDPLAYCEEYEGKPGGFWVITQDIYETLQDTYPDEGFGSDRAVYQHNRTVKESIDRFKQLDITDPVVVGSMVKILSPATGLEPETIAQISEITADGDHLVYHASAEKGMALLSPYAQDREWELTK